jgi:hypothetical protein
MTLTIDLTPTEEAQLRRLAAARGENQTDFAAHALRLGVAALAGEAAETEDALDPEGRPFAEFVAEVRAARQAL